MLSNLIKIAGGGGSKGWIREFVPSGYASTAGKLITVGSNVVFVFSAGDGGSQNGYITAINSSGGVVYQKSVGQTLTNDALYGISLTTNGFYVVGEDAYNGGVSFQRRPYIGKFDNSGNLVWQSYWGNVNVVGYATGCCDTTDYVWIFGRNDSNYPFTAAFNKATGAYVLSIMAQQAAAYYYGGTQSFNNRVLAISKQGNKCGFNQIYGDGGTPSPVSGSMFTPNSSLQTEVTDVGNGFFTGYVQVSGQPVSGFISTFQDNNLPKTLSVSTHGTYVTATADGAFFSGYDSNGKGLLMRTNGAVSSIPTPIWAKSLAYAGKTVQLTGITYDPKAVYFCGIVSGEKIIVGKMPYDGSLVGTFGNYTYANETFATGEVSGSWGFTNYTYTYNPYTGDTSPLLVQSASLPTSYMPT